MFVQHVSSVASGSLRATWFIWAGEGVDARDWKELLALQILTRWYRFTVRL